MAHEIYNDTAFFSLRQPAWHQLGNVAQDPHSIDEALVSIDMKRNYELWPLTTTVLTPEGVDTIEVPDKMAVMATHPVTGASTYQGVVGNGYVLHAPEEMDSTCRSLAGAGIDIETLGFLGKYGQKMFISFKLPYGYTVGNGDRTDLYLFATTAFDGSSATTFATGEVRVVCANTLRFGLNEAVSKAKIRHSALLAGKETAIAEMLELAQAQAEVGKQRAEDLTGVHTDVDKFLEQLFPIPSGNKTTRGETIATNKREAVEKILWSPTNPERKLNGWTLFNAVTEWADHEARAKSQDMRVQKILDGANQGIKDKALSLLLV